MRNTVLYSDDRSVVLTPLSPTVKGIRRANAEVAGTLDAVVTAPIIATVSVSAPSNHEAPALTVTLLSNDPADHDVIVTGVRTAIAAYFEFFEFPALRWYMLIDRAGKFWSTAKVIWECGFRFDASVLDSAAVLDGETRDVMSAVLLRTDPLVPAGPWRGPEGNRPAFADPHFPDKLVRQFHEVYGLPILDEPSVDHERVHMRMSLIAEEFAELCGAVYGEYAEKEILEAFGRVRAGDEHTRDVVETADALADLVYVTYGMGFETGIPLPAVLAEVQRSNLTKLGADGKPIYREDGKILKGPFFSEPNIARVLELHRARVAAERAAAALAQACKETADDEGTADVKETGDDAGE